MNTLQPQIPFRFAMTSISHAKIKFVKSLKSKKYRKKHGAFVIEGLKAISTMIEAGFRPQYLIQLSGLDISSMSEQDIYVADEKTMKSLTSFVVIPDVIGLFEMPAAPQLQDLEGINQHLLFLDRIQDPGNLGTIIRTADWYGVEHIICNEGCADPYNPKVLQATMGSHANVMVYAAEFEAASELLKNHIKVALDMDGVQEFPSAYAESPAMLIVGNEGQGLSEAIRSHVDLALHLAKVGRTHAESLNAAVALAIGLDRLIQFTKLPH